MLNQHIHNYPPYLEAVSPLSVTSERAVPWNRVIYKYIYIYIYIYIKSGALKNKRAGGLGTETSTSISEVFALAVEALVLLRQKAVNGCLVKFPGLRYESVPHVLFDVVVRGESFAPQCLFRGPKMA